MRLDLSARLGWLAVVGLAAGVGAAWTVSMAGPGRPVVPDVPLALPVAILVGWSFIGSGLLSWQPGQPNRLRLARGIYPPLLADLGVVHRAGSPGAHSGAPDHHRGRGDRQVPTADRRGRLLLRSGSAAEHRQRRAGISSPGDPLRRRPVPGVHRYPTTARASTRALPPREPGCKA